MDVTRQIGLVRREITTRKHEGKEARGIVAGRTYPTTMDDLWDALTNPERIPRWFLPVSGDLRPGGHYQLEGNASGDITTCEPPRHLAVTWVWDEQVSWVQVTLSPDPAGGTELRLEHISHLPDEVWDEYGPGAGGVGWDLPLLGLARHLATGDAVDPDAFMAWLGSEEGRAVVSASSEAWCEASIRGGTDPDAARAAAERTTGFYTPAPEGSDG